MMNRDEMLRTYNAHSAADAYVLGFAFRGELFAIELPELPRPASAAARPKSGCGWPKLRSWP